MISAQVGLSRHRAPVPTPPPTTESVAGTAVTSAGPVINASRTPGSASSGPFDTFALTATNGFIIFNGTTDTVNSANVIELYYIGHRTYQENQASLWWVWSGTAWTATSDPRGGVVAPPQATGTDQHGNRYQYTVPVFSAEFNSASDISSDTTGTVVAPFYSAGTDGFGGGLQPGSGGVFSISNSILTITKDNNTHGDGLDSVQRSSAAATSASPTTIVSGNPVYGYAGSGLTPPAANGNGIAFRYGYFEASISTNFTLDPVGWWPAWWMYPTIPTQINGGFMELDVFELYPQNNSNAYGQIIVHTGPNDGAAPQVLQGVNAGGYPPQSVINKAGFNAYGVLWTPTFIQYWVNGTGGTVMAMDAAIPYNKGSSLVGNNVMSLNQMFMVLIIGTGPNWPVQFDYVRGWQ